MEDPQNIPDPVSSQESADPGAEQQLIPPAPLVAGQPSPISPHQLLRSEERPAGAVYLDAESRRRSFRHNLFLLFSLSLAAFILTSWILVRVDAPFGMFAGGPQEVVRAQLRALDRGELRPAYDMFSARYRKQVSFDNWHELFLTHWRMFHGDVVRSETPAIGGAGVTLEIVLHGADDRNYRARFTMVRTDSRWWIDDVHWTEEADERDFSRT